MLQECTYCKPSGSRTPIHISKKPPHGQSDKEKKREREHMHDSCLSMLLLPQCGSSWTQFDRYLPSEINPYAKT